MDVFRVLSDPVRRDLLRQLVAGPLRVVDLAADRGISRPAVSRHLRLLSQSGLVHYVDRGRERHYQLDVGPLTQVQDLINTLGGRTNQAPVTDSTLDALETEVRRAGRHRRLGATRTTPTPTGIQKDTA